MSRNPRQRILIALALVFFGSSTAISADIEVVLKRIQNDIDVQEERMKCSLFFDVDNQTASRIERLEVPLDALGPRGNALRLVESAALQVGPIAAGGVSRDQRGPIFDGGYGFCDIDVLEVKDRYLFACETARGTCEGIVRLRSEVSDIDFRFAKGFGEEASSFQPGGSGGSAAKPVDQTPSGSVTPTPEEMYVLGLRYFRGEGVIQDYVYAHMWFNIAASLGLNMAKSERDRVAEKMTQGELAEARKLARQCVKRDYRGC